MLNLFWYTLPSYPGPVMNRQFTVSIIIILVYFSIMGLASVNVSLTCRITSQTAFLTDGGDNIENATLKTVTPLILQVWCESICQTVYLKLEEFIYYRHIYFWQSPLFDLLRRWHSASDDKHDLFWWMVWLLTSFTGQTITALLDEVWGKEAQVCRSVSFSRKSNKRKAHSLMPISVWLMNR